MRSRQSRKAVVSPARAISTALRVNAPASPSKSASAACVALWRAPRGLPGLPGPKRPAVSRPLLRVVMLAPLPRHQPPEWFPSQHQLGFAEMCPPPLPMQCAAKYPGPSRVRAFPAMARRVPVRAVQYVQPISFCRPFVFRFPAAPPCDSRDNCDKSPPSLANVAKSRMSQGFASSRAPARGKNCVSCITAD